MDFEISAVTYVSMSLKKEFSARVREMFQGGFIALSGLEGPNFSTFLTQAFSEGSTMETAVNALFKAAITIGAMLAVLQLARAGFMYMGGESWGTKEAAKQIMRQAVMGLLILISIWLILRQINPDLLDLNIFKRVQPLNSYPANTGEAPL